jgi:hypothetical protein
MKMSGSINKAKEFLKKPISKLGGDINHKVATELLSGALKEYDALKKQSDADTMEIVRLCVNWQSEIDKKFEAQSSCKKILTKVLDDYKSQLQVELCVLSNSLKRGFQKAQSQSVDRIDVIEALMEEITSFINGKNK